MAVEFKDYYQILGIPRSAGDEEIRRAFRHLARRYHPDITGNDRGAEDKFKELNEAYEVLGDPDRRRRYDEFTLHYPMGGFHQMPPGWDQFASASGNPRNRAEHFTFTGAGFSDFFEQLFGNDARPNFERETIKSEVREESDGKGEDLETDLWLTLEELATGVVRPITMRRAVRCKVCYGMGQYNAHSCEACAGSGNLIQAETFKVKVPAAIAEGACLRVPGRGEEGPPHGQPGDLFLKIRYRKHPEFHLEKGALTTEVELAPWEAVLGTTVAISTLQGRVQIKIPAGTQNGNKLRIKGRGLPSADGTAGDLLVTVKVQVPSALRDNERQLWEELARESAFHPRDN